jgi:hypothetical protein
VNLLALCDINSEIIHKGMLHLKIVGVADCGIDRQKPI